MTARVLRSEWTIPYVLLGKSDGEQVTIFLSDGSYIEGSYRTAEGE